MNFKTNLIQYFVSLVIFLGIDAVWLTVIAQKMYSKWIGDLMKENPNLLAALIFYLMYPLGIVLLALVPALRENSLTKAVFNGCLLGLLAYSAYDLTNLATLKDWPLFITVVDIAWGTFLTGLVSLLSYLVLKNLIGVV
jgi:uncharacterized membrane protein